MNISDYSLKIEIYKGTELVKEINCPKFYFLDYISKFVYEDSPYKVKVALLDGITHEFSAATITSFQ